MGTFPLFRQNIMFCWYFALFLLPPLLLFANGTLLGQMGEEAELNKKQDEQHMELPICRVCNCNRQMRCVDCLPKESRNGEFRLRMVRLPEWAESFYGANLNQPEFPHFSTHLGLRQLSLRHSQIASFHPLSFVSLPKLESISLADNSLQDFPPELFQPLGNLRALDLSGNRLGNPRILLPSKDHLLDRLQLDRNPLCPTSSQWPLAKQLQLANTGLVGVNGTHLSFERQQSPQQQEESNSSASSSLCHLSFPVANWNALEDVDLGANPSLVISSSALPALSQLIRLDLSNAKSLPDQMFTDFTRREYTKWQHLNVNGANVVEEAGAFEYFPFGEPDGRAAVRGNGLEGRAARWQFCSGKMEWLNIGQIGLRGELRLDGCANLKWLYAEGNILSGLHCGIPSPSSLASISLRSNQLRHFPECLLASAGSLGIIQLANNSIRHLPDQGRLLLQQFPRLQVLDLAHNWLRHFELSPPSSSTPAALLNYLNISNNQLHSFGISPSSPSASPLPLTSIDLSSNHLAEFTIPPRQLPRLQNLHLAQNPGIRVDAFVDGWMANSTLVQLDLANCSLELLPDLSQFPELTYLHVQGNRLRAMPGQRLPRKSLVDLDARGNLLERIGWDWSNAQIDALNKLHLQANPLDCACPMPKELAARLERNEEEKHSSSGGYYCVEDPNGGDGRGHWQHPLDAFLPPQTSNPSNDSQGHNVPSTAQQPHQPRHLFAADCHRRYSSSSSSSSSAPLPSPHHYSHFPIVAAGPFHSGPASSMFSMMATEQEQQPEPGDPSLFALFLLPIMLVAGSLGVAILLLKGSPRWQELHWANTEAGSMLAYEPLPVEQMADSV